MKRIDRLVIALGFGAGLVSLACSRPGPPPSGPAKGTTPRPSPETTCAKMAEQKGAVVAGFDIDQSPYRVCVFLSTSNSKREDAAPKRPSGVNVVVLRRQLGGYLQVLSDQIGGTTLVKPVVFHKLSPGGLPAFAITVATNRDTARQRWYWAQAGAPGTVLKIVDSDCMLEPDKHSGDEFPTLRSSCKTKDVWQWQAENLRYRCMSCKPTQKGKCDELMCLLAAEPSPCCSRFHRPASHSHGHSPARKGPLRPNGTRLTKAQIRAVMTTLTPKLKSCAKKYKEPKHRVARLKIVVGANGRVSSVMAGNVTHTGLKGCLHRAMRQATFPKRSVASSFTYPVSI